MIMSWALIFIRTFPFWATPLGMALITGWWASNRIKGRQGRNILWPIAGVGLIIGSACFLYFQGQFTAVPFVWELLRGPASEN
jgi:hypothetical protein